MSPRTGLLGIYSLSLSLSLTTPPFSLIDLIFIQKMMQLNIPLNDDGTIDFNSTLLGIVCQALCIETQGNRKQLRRKWFYFVIVGDIASLKQRLTALFPDKGLDKILPTDTGTVVSRLLL